MSRIPRTAVRLASGNGWVRERATRLGFVQKDLRRIWPGETIDAALEPAVELQVLGIRPVYAYLPDVDAPASANAQAVRDEHLALLEALAATEVEGELSVSPATLGMDRDPDACLGHLAAIAAAAEARGSWLWLEMTGSQRVERTLDLYPRLRASHLRTGVSLQASLRRTATDVERLLPIAPAIRLVKGFADEPREVVLPNRRDIDANYLALAVTLLREGRARPMRLAVATHDLDLIDQVTSHAAAVGIARGGFDIQMRYGVRARDQRRLAREGHAVQTLIAYGPGWYPWYAAQMADRPVNALGALRRLLPG